MVASPVAPPGAAETPVLHGAARVAAASRTGSRRAVNQDRWLVQRESGYRPVLLAVADGVGGGASGERASAAAVDALAAAWDAWQPPSPPTRRSVEQRLIAAAQAADAAVRQLATGDGAATTLTAAVPLYPTGLLVHAGDSRAFAARPGDAVARQLTTDHSLAAVAPRAPRHVITRYLGQAGGCVFDAITVSLEADHRLILCTDGASNTLTATRIAECARLESAAGAVAELMAEIEQHDPTDDATVVILTPTPCPRDPFHLRPALRPQRTARRPALALGAIGAAAAGAGVLAAGVSALPRAAGKLMAPFRTSPHSTAAEYLAHWEAARFAEMHQLLSGEAQRRIDRDAFVRRYESIASQMTLTQLSTRIAPRDAAQSPSEALVLVDVTYATARFGELTRRVELPLVWDRGRWRIDWRPTTILPELPEGYLVRAFSEPLLRGAILDRRRRPLASFAGGRRAYPEGSTAGSLVGYVGEVTADELKTLAARGYLAGDTIGKAGLEAATDLMLTGQRGGRLTVIQPTGDVAATLSAIPSRSGESALLSLDLDLQREAEAALGPRTGSIVVIDPTDGGLRALATFPRYDPNAFVTGQDAAAILADPRRPLLHRPTQGVYTCGSTMKAITMAAGLESGLFRPESEFSCAGRWTGLPGLTFHCWNPSGHGRLSLVSGLAQSCNSVFYEVGKRLDEWNADFFPDFARRAGLGSPPGALPGGEATGTVPTPAWKRDTLKEPWTRGDAVNLAIGQGSLLVSPLQVASLYAAIANGGALSGPRLLDRAVLPGGAVDRPLERATRRLPWSGETLAAVRAGLKDVVGAPHGTAAFVFHGSPLAGLTAGKTGTAESAPGRPTHAWFAGFAPFDAPRALVLVMLEHGGEGSRDAAPIARRVLEAALAPD